VELRYQTKKLTLSSGALVSSAKILTKAPLYGNTSVIIEYAIKKASTNTYRTGRLVVSAHPTMAQVSSPLAPVIRDDFSTTTAGVTTSTATDVDGGITFYASASRLNTATGLAPTLVISYSNAVGTAEIEFVTKIISTTQDY
jgi:hypothetical protein